MSGQPQNVSFFLYEYLSAYSCVNVMNDLSKKNKNILLLG